MARPAPAHPTRRQRPLPGQRPKPRDEDPRRLPPCRPSCKAQAIARPTATSISWPATKPAACGCCSITPRRKGAAGAWRRPHHRRVRRHADRRTARRPAGRGQTASAALQASRRMPTLRRRLAIARRVVANSRYYDEARALGRLVGAAAAAGARRPHHGDDRRRTRHHGSRQSRRARPRRAHRSG